MDLRNYICIYQKTLDNKSIVCYNNIIITHLGYYLFYDYIRPIYTTYRLLLQVHGRRSNAKTQGT